MGTHPIFESDFDCLTEMGAKKGKKGGKKGGKGKGKGKKEGKKAFNRDEELKAAITNALLWKQKLELTERQRDDYRDTCRKLAAENENVSDSLYQAERDTIDVISLLKREDITKFKNIQQLTKRVAELEEITGKERARIEAEFNEKRAVLEGELAERTKEVALLQKELKSVNEFRKNKAKITEEIKEMREQLAAQKAENEKNKQRMEHEFFVEKMKMEREAGQKIAQYAEKAQKEAISGLDETTRKVFRDNVQMSEVMDHHVEENNSLRDKNRRLSESLKKTRQELEINEITVRAKIAETRRAKDEIVNLSHSLKEARSKLDKQKQESNDERQLVLSTAVQQSAIDRADIARLQQTLSLRESEMKKVKLLAKKVIDERSDMEKFFIEALDYVCRQIRNSRGSYVKSAKSAYHAQMAAAANGKADLPPVKTFGAKQPHSTNAVQKDLQAAEDWTYVTAKTDISELTWEQKEKIIRLLFAKLNGVSKDKKSSKPLPPIHSRVARDNARGESSRIGSSKSVLSEIEMMKKAELETPTDNPIFITQEG